MTDTKDKQACPSCKRRYGVPYLYQHMREQHRIFGGATGIKRHQASDNGKLLPAVIEAPAKPKAPTFKPLPMMVLEDQDGGVWLAERIK